MLFPGAPSVGARTRFEIDEPTDAVDKPQHVWWVGSAHGDTDPTGTAPRVDLGPGMPLFGEHAHGRLTRPHLRGHRVTAHQDSEPAAGGSWTPRFSVTSWQVDGESMRIVAKDETAGLDLTMEWESVPGGALRGRYLLTNLALGSFMVEGLEVVLPVPDSHVEALDFTGRHERERSPQRHAVTDGLWLRESRGGRPGLDAATQLVVGTPGFSFDRGEVLAAHVAWSGNSVLRLERSAATGTTLGGGELLLPGEVVLHRGDTYETPWVMFAAATGGLDELAAVWHGFQRSLPAHPRVQPVILNVWEAVFFDHDLGRLKRIADRAAQVGVERFVLDDGWFRHRRDDSAGLGDWYVDEEVWPEGLEPIIEHVHRLGMEFGLWFEPEMVNPDSDLMRAHPDWILSSGDRVPLPHRNQLVLDITRDEVREFLFERVDALLTRYPIDYVKWDHNRDLIEAGSATRGGAPAVHAQTKAFYQLLDSLRQVHPSVAWESCASGGGRIDLAVLERAERVWTSDMTDALARQHIQRWTQQLVAPEYAGAHVSATTSHTTWRTLSLDFRAATAMFGAFGIEWDLTEASQDDLDRLGEWVARHRRFRPLLHSGRVIRADSSDPAVLLHGVIAIDGSEALLAHVQMDESHHNRGVSFRVPGLQPDRAYRVCWEGPIPDRETSKSPALPQEGPTQGRPVSGFALQRQGFWIPRLRPATAALVHVSHAD